MKQKDIAIIVLIAGVTGIFTLVITNMFLNNHKQRQEKVEVVERITADFPAPDSKYFNGNSVNPTKLIRIGDTNNPAPFNTKQ